MSGQTDLVSDDPFGSDVFGSCLSDFDIWDENDAAFNWKDVQNEDFTEATDESTVQSSCIEHSLSTHGSFHDSESKLGSSRRHRSTKSDGHNDESSPATGHTGEGPDRSERSRRPPCKSKSLKEKHPSRKNLMSEAPNEETKSETDGRPRSGRRTTLGKSQSFKVRQPHKKGMNTEDEEPKAPPSNPPVMRGPPRNLLARPGLAKSQSFRTRQPRKIETPSSNETSDISTGDDPSVTSNGSDRGSRRLGMAKSQSFRTRQPRRVETAPINENSEKSPGDDPSATSNGSDRGSRRLGMAKSQSFRTRQPRRVETAPIDENGDQSTGDKPSVLLPPPKDHLRVLPTPSRSMNIRKVERRPPPARPGLGPKSASFAHRRQHVVRPVMLGDLMKEDKSPSPTSVKDLGLEQEVHGESDVGKELDPSGRSARSRRPLRRALRHGDEICVDEKDSARSSRSSDTDEPAEKEGDGKSEDNSRSRRSVARAGSMNNGKKPQSRVPRTSEIK